MTTNNRWFSPHGFSITITHTNDVVEGLFLLPRDLGTKKFSWKGFSLLDAGKFHLAFIINWPTTSSKAYTAFNGVQDIKGNLSLDWLCSSENLISEKITKTRGESLLTMRRPITKCQYLELQHCPCPNEILNTSIKKNANF